MSESMRLAEFFARLSTDLSGADGTEVFDDIARRALEVVHDADHCTITLRPRGAGRSATLETAAATSDVAARSDALQAELQEGPCYEAAFEVQDFVVSDLVTETRWPRWAASASELGIRSLYAVAIRGGDGVVGALNFLADRPRAFDDPDDRSLADVFASHANNAMHSSRLVEGLRTALESRHAIGMAQGVIATRYGITYEQAFDVLHRLSNDTNTKLREVAQDVLDARGLPED